MEKNNVFIRHLFRVYLVCRLGGKLENIYVHRNPLYHLAVMTPEEITAGFQHHRHQWLPWCSDHTCIALFHFLQIILPMPKLNTFHRLELRCRKFSLHKTLFWLEYFLTASLCYSTLVILLLSSSQRIITFYRYLASWNNGTCCMPYFFLAASYWWCLPVRIYLYFFYIYI